jgi:hypothetical protein
VFNEGIKERTQPITMIRSVGDHLLEVAYPKELAGILGVVGSNLGQHARKDLSDV